jgi:hypothetical protein
LPILLGEVAEKTKLNRTVTRPTSQSRLLRALFALA